jgi:hypothetical protein
MDRRTLIASGLISGLAAAAPRAFAQDASGQTQGDQYRRLDGQDRADTYRDPDNRYPADQGMDGGRGDRDDGPDGPPAQPYTKEELARNVSDFFGVTAENAGALVEKIFREQGQPTAYIAGLEGSGAFFFGLRYGKGLMYMKDRRPMDVFWQGPTGGFDFGGNASRVFTLCYNLQYPDAVFRRFPGVEGSAYLVGGLGVNYQRAEDITLAPIRAGLGLRLGASVGYLAYSRKRNVIPL